MNILLTGSNGFVGQAVASRIKDYGTVIGLGRNPQNQCRDVAEYICADLADEAAVSSLQRKTVDAIVHVAANLDMSSENPHVLYDNVMGTYNLTRIAVKMGVKRFIYISSLPVVGSPERGNTQAIQEEQCPHPETVYHISKLTGEYLVELLKNHGIVTTSLRIPSPIGKGMSQKTILSVFLERAYRGKMITLMGKGNRRQNYVDVRDIAEAVACSLNATILSPCYNIVSKATISNKELAERCIAALHSSSSINFQGVDLNDDVDWKADGTKAEKELGFIPQYQLEQTIEWMLPAMKEMRG